MCKLHRCGEILSLFFLSFLFLLPLVELNREAAATLIATPTRVGVIASIIVTRNYGSSSRARRKAIVADMWVNVIRNDPDSFPASSNV